MSGKGVDEKYWSPEVKKSVDLLKSVAKGEAQGLDEKFWNPEFTKLVSEFSGVPTPVDRPSDLGELGLSEETAATLNKSGVTAEDSMDVAVAKLTKDNNDPKSILKAMSELVEKQEAKVMAYATQNTPEQPVSAKGTSAVEVFTSGEGGLDSSNKGVRNGKIIGTNHKTALNGKPLSKNIVGDIMDAQARGELFAVGSMQVVPETLKEAVQKGAISREEIFGKESQEKLTDYLINTKRPKLGAYLRGESDDEQAALLEAAQEFASWPDPRTGKSYYADKGNKHQFDVAEAKRKLNSMRKGQATPKGLGVLSPSFQPKLSKADQPLVTKGSGEASRMVKQGSFKRLDKVLQGPYQSAFVKFREKFGKDLVINDAIAKAGTSREKNTPGSRHFHGDALDISTRGMNNKEKLELFKILKESGFKGFGFGATIIHADMGSKRAWSYKNKSYGGVSVSKLIAEAKS